MTENSILIDEDGNYEVRLSESHRRLNKSILFILVLIDLASSWGETSIDNVIYSANKITEEMIKKCEKKGHIYPLINLPALVPSEPWHLEADQLRTVLELFSSIEN